MVDNVDYGFITPSVASSIHELSMRHFPDYYNKLNVYSQTNLVYTAYNFGYSPIDERLVNDDPLTQAHDTLYLAGLDALPSNDLGSVLDIGCGRGRGIDTIRRLYNTTIVFGCDINSITIDLGKREFTDVNLMVANAEDMPYNDSVFDTIFSVEMASYCSEDRNILLNEVNRVLKPGGYFLYTDTFLHDDEALATQAILEQHFEVVRVENITQQAKDGINSKFPLVAEQNHEYFTHLILCMQYAAATNVFALYNFVLKSKK